MFKTLHNNRNEILSGILLSLIFFAGLFYGKTYFPPLAYVLSFGYYLMIAGLVFFSPWFFISITMPNTLGKFINEWFEAGWRALGTPPEYRFNKHGKKAAGDEEYEYSSHLQRCFLFTIAVYAVLVLAGAFIALAAFSQGISIPVMGN